MLIKLFIAPYTQVYIVSAPMHDVYRNRFWPPDTYVTGLARNVDRDLLEWLLVMFLLGASVVLRRRSGMGSQTGPVKAN